MAVIISDYNINGVQLARDILKKDLGMTMDSKLEFYEHVRRVRNSAFRTLGFLIRNAKEFKNEKVLRGVLQSMRL